MSDLPTAEKWSRGFREAAMAWSKESSTPTTDSLSQFMRSEKRIAEFRLAAAALRSVRESGPNPELMFAVADWANAVAETEEPEEDETEEVAPTDLE